MPSSSSIMEPDVDSSPVELATMQRMPLGWSMPHRLSFSVPFTKGDLCVMLDGELMSRQEYTLSRSDYAGWSVVNLGPFRLLLRASW